MGELPASCATAGGLLVAKQDSATKPTHEYVRPSVPRRENAEEKYRCRSNCGQRVAAVQPTDGCPGCAKRTAPGRQRPGHTGVATRPARAAERNHRAEHDPHRRRGHQVLAYL